MKFKKAHLFPIFIIVISFIIGIFFLPRFPEEIASHWGADGQVNGYMPKFWGLFFMPILSLGLFFLLRFLPKTDPYKENFREFEKYYDNFIVIIFIFLFYVYLTTIFWNLGYRFNMIQILSPAFAVIFYYAGVLMAKAKRNWFVGIRTPWTISSEKVWDKTHKIGAKLFKLTAAITLLSFFLPSYALFFIIAPIILSTVFLFLYSYLEYQKIKK